MHIERIVCHPKNSCIYKSSYSCPSLEKLGSIEISDCNADDAVEDLDFQCYNAKLKAAITKFTSHTVPSNNYLHTSSINIGDFLFTVTVAVLKKELIHVPEHQEESLDTFEDQGQEDIQYRNQLDNASSNKSQGKERSYIELWRYVNNYPLLDKDEEVYNCCMSLAITAVPWSEFGFRIYRQNCTNNKSSNESLFKPLRWDLTPLYQKSGCETYSILIVLDMIGSSGFHIQIIIIYYLILCSHFCL